MPAKKRNYAEYSGQDASQGLSAVEQSSIVFIIEYMKTGSLGSCSRSDGHYRYHFPSAPTLVQIYVKAYKLRMAALMNDVIKYISDLRLSFKKMARQIWRITAGMDKALGGRCPLRDLILDEVLAEVHEGRTPREDIEVNYPIDFQRDFFPRLWMLSIGKYTFGLDKAGSYNHEFLLDEGMTGKKNEGGKKKKVKLSPTPQLHTRVLELLKLKGSFGSGEDEPFDPQTPALGGGSVPSERTRALFSSELRALEKYIEAFPGGFERIQTSADKLLCGLDSISKTVAAMHPTLPCPSVSDLQEIVASEEYQRAAEDFALENETVNTSLFTADQLAKILQLWGQRSAIVFQLGWLTDNGLPCLVPCLNEDMAHVVWLHNDDAEAKFSGVAMGSFGAEFEGILGHWSGLRPKSSSKDS